MRNLQNIQIRTGSGFETVCPFPVGAIYQSTNSTSPANIYGGGWTALTDGRFLRPQGSWNGLGGENEHKLTTNELPSHNHGTSAGFSFVISDSTFKYGSGGITAPAPNSTVDRTGSTGNNWAHNNIPAYRTCYCWYRTS